MQPPILPPRAAELLSPLLASLPAASISPQPPTALLPLLSPILRQRVQLLSSPNSSSEPWLPLLCYDSSSSSKLASIVRNERFEPHPVSGEVEIDWAAEASTAYRRIDAETLQARVSLQDLELGVKLTWCTNDEVGGGDGWRISELLVLSQEDSGWGYSSIGQAEEAYHSQPTIPPLSNYTRTNGANSLLTPGAEEEDDDDDDYWAQYDNTPARTPAPKASPAPRTSIAPLSAVQRNSSEDDDRYYAQYATVQPAMDNHDPDEAKTNGGIESTLGQDEITQELRRQNGSSHQSIDKEHEVELHNSTLAWSQDQEAYTNGHSHLDATERMEGLAHPRPGSSTGSSGSSTVEKLERTAAREQSNELGIKQHIGTSIKSLYRLARVAGIERGEFERLVKTELECLSMMDEDDG